MKYYRPRVNIHLKGTTTVALIYNEQNGFMVYLKRPAVNGNIHQRNPVNPVRKGSGCVSGPSYCLRMSMMKQCLLMKEPGSIFWVKLLQLLLLILPLLLVSFSEGQRHRQMRWLYVMYVR